MIGCQCPVCSSSDPRNHRWRSSLYVSADSSRLLIDTSPDFREQSLRFHIQRIDAVLLTHAHVDHLFGLDDIRRFNTLQDNSTIPLYGSPQSICDVRRIFDYIFLPNIAGTYRPKIDLHPIESPFSIPNSSLLISPIEITHGSGRTFGYRIDFCDHHLAYIPDCHSLPKSSFALLNNLDWLILDALKYSPHPTHLSLSESLALINKINPRQAFLTHIGHDLDHASLCQTLPPHIRPAYDGLIVY